MNMNNEMLDYEQAAALLGVTPGQLRGMVHRREIPFVRLAARTIRFMRAQLDEFIAQRNFIPSQLGNNAGEDNHE